MNEIIQNNWLNHFLKELKAVNTVYLISPFITNTTVEHLLENISSPTKIKVITRFNLNDFRSKVSSLSAVKKLVQKGIEIRGIKNLHSKVYIFDNKSVIIGSANFTSGGFFNNYEYGIKTIDRNVIYQSVKYFESLWDLNSNNLTINQVSEWEKIIKESTPTPQDNTLFDYGTPASIQGESKRRYFIKFFGKSDHRENLHHLSRNEIERAHCHWALTFSGKRGIPRRYNDGDIVYMARMLHGNDYAIFGKGIAIKHIDNRDKASDEDINEINWKVDWSIYVRVKNTEFIDSSMGNCPKLNYLINTLKYDSFFNTQKRFLNGEENINVRDSLRRQADIELSEISAEWLENEFQEAKIKFGTVSQSYIDTLYPGKPSLLEILNGKE